MVYQNKAMEEASGHDLLVTSDLGATTALVSKECELLLINKQNPKKVLFAFERNKATEELLGAYWSNALLVPARAYFDNLKMLKSRIYED